MIVLLLLSTLLAAAGQNTSTPSVSSGHYHTCVLERRQGIDSGGGVRCFGQTYGQAPPGIFKEVSSGHVFSCALRMDNTVSCWGSIHGTPENTRFQSISSGSSHACGITNSGVLMCWGEGFHGEADPPSGQFKQASCGNSYTCGLKNSGAVTCFGKIDHAPDSDTFVLISAGKKNKMCGITSKGDVKCWGSLVKDKSCELREGPFLQVSTGYKGTCALNSNRTVDCWNQFRRLIPSNSTKTFQHISLGVDHACAIDDEGSLECWHNGPNLGAHEIPLGLSVAVKW